MILAYYFGFRDSTISALRLSDLSLHRGPTVLTLSEEFAKGSFGAVDHYYRVLEMDLSTLPGFAKATRLLLGHATDLHLIPSQPLLAVVSASKSKLQASL